MIETDVRYSLYRFIVARAAELGYSNPRIIGGPSGLPEDRPIWVVESVPNVGAMQDGQMYTKFERRYNILFLTKDGAQGMVDAENWVSNFEDKMVSNHFRIPGILIDFSYPAPSVIEDVGAGNLSVGTYYVAVSGISFMFTTEETLISSVQSVTTTAPNGRLDVIIPRFPRSFNWFKTYNVFAGTAADQLKKTADSPIAAGSPSATLKTIDDMPAGVAPSLTQSEIRYRIMEVIRDSFNLSVQSDPSEANNWMGVITLTINAPHEPIIPQHYPIRAVTYTITPT